MTETVRDLEQRGLLQYDGRTRRHDIHPVVRGVAAGGIQTEDKERYGQRVVDHFSSLSHNPYDQAETLEDLHAGLNIVRTLLKLGHLQQAATAYRGDLARALRFNVEAYAETLSLLRPFFPDGWEEPPQGVEVSYAGYLANNAGQSLSNCGELKQALAVYGVALEITMKSENWYNTFAVLRNIQVNLSDQNLLAKSSRINSLAIDFSTVYDNQERLFNVRLHLFSNQSLFGQWSQAETTWQLLESMGFEWSRAAYRPGDAEYDYAQFHYWNGTLQEVNLATAEQLATQGNNRLTIRDLHQLRGVWRLDQGEWAHAAMSFHEAVRMARESGIPDATSETGLALAKFHLGQLVEPQHEAKRLAQLREPAHYLLAKLWLAIDNKAQARHHALAAYQWAWADGEPYVRRHALTRTTELLQQMQIPIPNLPPYDPAKDEPFPWEADVRAAIEKLRVEKAADRDK